MHRSLEFWQIISFQLSRDLLNFLAKGVFAGGNGLQIGVNVQFLQNIPGPRF